MGRWGLQKFSHLDQLGTSRTKHDLINEPARNYWMNQRVDAEREKVRNKNEKKKKPKTKKKLQWRDKNTTCNNWPMDLGVPIDWAIIMYILPEKPPYTLPLEPSCNKSLYLNDDLLFIALWPRRSFSANSKGARALCLHNSLVCFGCVTKAPGRCYMPYRHEKEKTLAAMPCRNGTSLCKIPYNLTYYVLKVK